MKLVLKSISARNDSVEAPVLPYDLEELREFRALIRVIRIFGFWVNRHSKM